jgi:RNA polymerase sigma factor (sigma-70 family)
MSSYLRRYDRPQGKEVEFPPTHWTLVLSAGRPGSVEAEAAVASLCQMYWYPLYVFIRRQGHNSDDAQDLVQGFFARLLEKNYIGSADPEKGRFRSFLLLSLKRFMANEWDRAKRQKRGGGAACLPLEGKEFETRYVAEPQDEMSPDKAFERRWAMTLLQQVSDRLKAEFADSGRAHIFEEVKHFITGGQIPSSYAEIAQRLKTTEGSVKVLVHRLRRRFRELLRFEIAKTVDSPETIDDEIRELFAALR